LSTNFPHASLATWRDKLLPLALVLGMTAAYLLTLTPGHVFFNDDFAGYVLHATNLVEGRPYTAINYVPNLHLKSLAPPNGYPPVYPMILAPVYRVWGLNLRALKAATVLCFGIFLVIFARLATPKLPLWLLLFALLFIGCNPIFWEQRDYILSEFPYLMFSFGTLLVIQNTYKNLSHSELRLGTVLLLSAVLYCAYGTRTIGISLLGALILADLAKFKRPSRFLLAVVACTVALIVAQTVLITSPKGYVSAVQFSWATIYANALFYGKTLSYVWQNGFSKKLQICLALFFTALATIGFLRNTWKERSAGEFYLAGYLMILFIWPSQIGLRGLLPVLPLYFFHGLQELGSVVKGLSPRIRVILPAALLVFVGISYAGFFKQMARQDPAPNVLDPAAQEMFSFIRANSKPSDVIVSANSHSMSLFTKRPATFVTPYESPEEVSHFIDSVHATILVQARWNVPCWPSFLEDSASRDLQIFSNTDFHVFRIGLKKPIAPVKQLETTPF
jgi:hypothetical protein